MKNISLKKHLVASLAVAGLALTPALHAQVEVFIEGGSASSSILFQAATNILNGGAITVPNLSNSSVRTFSGTSTLPTLSGAGTITLDFNLNGAVIGLQNLIGQHTDTNILGASIIPVAVDSATYPESVGLLSSSVTELPTFVVPLVFIKNTNSIDTAGITNLTQRQAVTLETSATNPAVFYGGANYNPVYFVGRNSQAAVRTVTDLVIYNSSSIQSYLTNSAGQPVYDTNADPGLQFGGSVGNTVAVLTNSIGTVAVQNIVKGTAPLAYEGVPYSPANVENGSYPLWGYEHYYYITSATGKPTDPQKAVILALYNQVTNASFQVTSVFTNKFIPNTAMRVHRNAPTDGGPIFLNTGY